VIKIKDFFFAGIMAGVIGGLIFDLYMFVLKFFKVNTRTPWGDSTALLFNPPEIHMFFAQLYGFLMSLSTPIFIAIAFCLLVKLRGKDYIYVKSVAISEFVSVFTITTVYPLLGLRFLKHSITTHYAGFFGMLLFGVILGYLVKKNTDFENHW
jgi:hypothetical protein